MLESLLANAEEQLGVGREMVSTLKLGENRGINLTLPRAKLICFSEDDLK